MTHIILLTHSFTELKVRWSRTVLSSAFVGCSYFCLPECLLSTIRELIVAVCHASAYKRYWSGIILLCTVSYDVSFIVAALHSGLLRRLLLNTQICSCWTAGSLWYVELQYKWVAAVFMQETDKDVCRWAAPKTHSCTDTSMDAIRVPHHHFWLARSSSPEWASTHWCLKICKSQQRSNRTTVNSVLWRLLKITTCQTFTTRVLTGRKSVKTQMKNQNKIKKNKQQHWLGENLDTCFLYCMFFFFTKWSLIITLIFFNPNLGIYGGIVSNFVCQLKMAVYGWLSLLAMEPVAQTGVWIRYWVQCDFKGNPCRMFLLICHSRMHIFNYVVYWLKQFWTHTG